MYAAVWDDTSPSAPEKTIAAAAGWSGTLTPRCIDTCTLRDNGGVGHGAWHGARHCSCEAQIPVLNIGRAAGDRWAGCEQRTNEPQGAIDASVLMKAHIRRNLRVAGNEPNRQTPADAGARRNIRVIQRSQKRRI